MPYVMVGDAVITLLEDIFKGRKEKKFRERQRYEGKVGIGAGTT